jgi:amino acid transporter
VIGGRRPLQGRKAGDRRVRVDRPHTAYFRYAGPNQLVAREAASRPRTATGRTLARLRSILFGRPLSNYEEIEERLPKKKALAIFSSDPISSSAYATEEILRVLVLAGTGALLLSLPIAAAIALLLAVVSVSYRQIGYAYPSGGGAYAVARANLGKVPSLVAAGALLVDYVMTVAVSTASAVDQVISAIPELVDGRVVMGVLAVLLITVGNLRGLRESGNIFAIPTYLFVGSALLMIALGVLRIVVLGEGAPPPSPLPGAPDPLQPIGLLLILRAFASGSVALTGTEAIANGVPAFKPPEPVNAAKTLTAVAVLLAILFIGITFVADSFGIVPLDEPVKRTVISQVAAAIYGDGSIGFYLFQAFTALILFLAANTSYNAFPRLAAILADDGFMPRQFGFRGDRLAFTLGIVILSLVAISLVVLFAGDTHALIPLYSVGVFVSFTISQGGMVRHWLRERTAGWRWRLAINGFGCVLTAVVAVIVTIAKAPESLLVAIVIPILVAMMLFINRQYQASKAELAVRDDVVLPGPQREERVIVPVPGINRAVVQAVNVGRSIADDVRAVLIADDADEATRVRERWNRQLPDVPLVIVESPYRALVGPLLSYLDVLDQAWPPDKPDPITFVIIPEYVARSWWERLLYNQSAKRLRAALLGRHHTVVVNVPYRRDEPDPLGATA